LLDAAAATPQAVVVIGPRPTVLTVAIVATLAGGGSAAATWGHAPVAADRSTEVVSETSTGHLMELPSGCAGDDWGSEGSID
jgi:hypothetical protein